MARRVIVETLCDPCLAGGVESQAVELPPLPLVGNKPRIVALCVKHHGELAEPLIEALKEFGQIVDIEGGEVKRPKAGQKLRDAANDGQFDCPECREAGTPRSFAAPQGLGAHRYRAHGVESASKAKAS